MNSIDAFLNAATEMGGEYTALHKKHGITTAHWDLLTQGEHWNAEERRQVGGILTTVLTVGLTIAGLPERTMPGQFAAGLVAKIVAPANWAVACFRLPETFDARAAAGVDGASVIKPMSYEQILGLVLYIAGEGVPRVQDDPEMERERAAEAAK